MDPNAQQPQQQTSQPVPQQEVYQEMPHSSLPKMLWIILGVIIVLGLIGGAYYLGVKKGATTSNENMAVKPTMITPSATVTQTTSPTSLPTTTTSSMTNWKTYTDAKNTYSFSYPASWYLTEANDPVPCVSFSDIPNPPSQASSHQLLNVCYIGEPLPTTFPYDNGQSNNPTITSITMSGYSGIRGQEYTADGLSELVFLKDPQGVYPRNGVINFTLWNKDNENTFNQILASFKFK